MTYQHHLLFIAPDAPESFFYDIAGDYWRVFQPLVTRSLDFLHFIPQNDKVLLTILCLPHQAEELLEDVFSQREEKTLIVDLIVVDDNDVTLRILSRRVKRNLPAGGRELRFDETA